MKKITTFYAILHSSKTLSMVFTSVAAIMVELISWFINFTELTLPSLIAAPILGAILGLIMFEYRKQKNKLKLKKYK